MFLPFLHNFCWFFNFLVLNKFSLHFLIFSDQKQIKPTSSQFDMHQTEKKLVHDISTVQGLRPQPSKGDIDALIKRYKRHCWWLLVFLLLLCCVLLLVFEVLQYRHVLLQHNSKMWFNPLSAGIFTVFGLMFLVIGGQSVTQGSKGWDPPRNPPWGPGL